MTNKIVFLDRETLGENVILRRPAPDHVWIDFNSTSPNQTRQRLMEAQIVVTNKVAITAEVLDTLPQIKMIAVAATGTNIIDIEACKKANVTVCNIRNYGTSSVAEHSLACILSLKRNLVSYREEVLDGRWQTAGQFCYFNTPMSDLKGSVLGLIGTGTIAKEVAKLGKALGMSVILHSLSGRQTMFGYDLVTLEELIASSDIISLHCPLSEKSENLLNDAAFKKMTKRPILINTARGEIIDLAALERALDAGHLRGAAIDVAEKEPPTADDILMNLAKRRNVIVTPHIAWASMNARQTLADQLIDNIEAFIAGTPQNVVT